MQGEMMMRALLPALAFVLAGCSNVATKPGTAFDRISDEMRQATAERAKASRPEAVDRALLPPARETEVMSKNRLRSKSRLLDSRPHFGPPSGGLLSFVFGFTSTIA